VKSALPGQTEALSHRGRLVTFRHFARGRRGLKNQKARAARNAIEIDIATVDSTISEFRAIGEDPKKIAAFVNSSAPSLRN
jgi:hypothetical protein